MRAQETQEPGVGVSAGGEEGDVSREAHTRASAELGTVFLKQSARTQVLPLVSFYVLISLKSDGL